MACGLPSLTSLNASRCHSITMEGLACLGQAADRLKQLNLGWCEGLRGSARRAGGSPDGSRRGDDDMEEEFEGRSVDRERGRREAGVRVAGAGGRGREEWALPPLPRLEVLCLARFVTVQSCSKCFKYHTNLSPLSSIFSRVAGWMCFSSPEMKFAVA